MNKGHYAQETKTTLQLRSVKCLETRQESSIPFIESLIGKYHIKNGEETLFSTHDILTKKTEYCKISGHLLYRDLRMKEEKNSSEVSYDIGFLSYLNFLFKIHPVRVFFSLVAFIAGACCIWIYLPEPYKYVAILGATIGAFMFFYLSKVEIVEAVKEYHQRGDERVGIRNSSLLLKGVVKDGPVTTQQSKIM